MTSLRSRVAVAVAAMSAVGAGCGGPTGPTQVAPTSSDARVPAGSPVVGVTPDALAVPGSLGTTGSLLGDSKAAGVFFVSQMDGNGGTLAHASPDGSMASWKLPLSEGAGLAGPAPAMTQTPPGTVWIGDGPRLVGIDTATGNWRIIDLPAVRPSESALALRPMRFSSFAVTGLASVDDSMVAVRDAASEFQIIDRDATVRSVPLPDGTEARAVAGGAGWFAIALGSAATHHTQLLLGWLDGTTRHLTETAGAVSRSGDGIVVLTDQGTTIDISSPKTGAYDAKDPVPLAVAPGADAPVVGGQLLAVEGGFAYPTRSGVAVARASGLVLHRLPPPTCGEPSRFPRLPDETTAPTTPPAPACVQRPVSMATDHDGNVWAVPSGSTGTLQMLPAAALGH